MPFLPVDPAILPVVASRASVPHPRAGRDASPFPRLAPPERRSLRQSGAGRSAARALFVLVAALAWIRAGRPLAAAPLISEFMADNRSALADENGEFNDWIEIRNPDPAPVALGGYFLTDNPNTPRRWAFPAVTVPAQGYLLVFASGHDRRVAGQPLHTNFRLDADGEYLALIAPDGRTVLDAFAPSFPPQSPDISYGRPPAGTVREVLGPGRLIFKIPMPGSPLESGWIEPGFGAGPGAGWQPAVGFGLGYDAGFAGGEAAANLARPGTATQSSTVGNLRAGLAIDGNLSTFTSTGSDDNRSTWTVDLGREHEVTHVVLHNRSDCCQSRLRDLTVSLLGPDGTTVVWRSGLLNPENTLDDPARLEIDLFDLEVGPVPARFVRVERTPDPDLSGSQGQGNNDEDNVLSLAEVEVRGADSITYGELLRTDLTGSLRHRGVAVAARLEFPLDAASLPGLTEPLTLWFDDGIVAWLNGQELTRTNAPADLSGTAPAPASRSDADGLRPVSVPIPPGLLHEGTNVLALLGFNVGTDDDDFLLSARLTTALPGVPPPAYFDRATPGAPNTGEWYLGRLEAPRFNVERGFPTQPFDLVLTVPTNSAASVIYTLDGSEPTSTHGTLYQAPLRIDGTRVVRARAIRADFRSSPVVSHTYLFAVDTLRQPVAPVGFPTRWATVDGDYEMDPAITRNPAYARRLPDALRALPTVSLATEVDGLFGASRGIYANPENRGTAWERPVSMEWIDPETGKTFQSGAGLRIQGGYFRQRGATQKHSLRVVFKDEYGAGRLRTDLFDQFGAAREFDTLVLRAGANDGYAWDGARDTEQFLRDEFGRRLSLAMGQPAPHGRFVHVYLNGLYWGIYNLCERPNEDFSATYLGGTADEWDAVNAGEVKSGDLGAWNQFVAAARTATTFPAFLRLQGLAPDGHRDPALPVFLDVDHYADYMLLNIWGGNWDWPNKNFWFGRQRTADSTGFKFYLWDFENTMGNSRDRSPLGMIAPRADIASEWVAAPHAGLKSNPEYRLRFGDRVQRHLLGTGPLSPAALVARYRALANALEPAVLAEIARWGDDHYEPPQDLDDWLRERDWILGSYLPKRTDVVLGQLRTAGLYPAVTAPVIAAASSPVGRATPIHLRTPARWLFYTLDGTDPRLPGGEPSPGARRVEFPGETAGPGQDPIVVPATATWKYWDQGTDPGAGWTQPGYPEALWSTGRAQLGYGDGDEATLVLSVDTDPVLAGVQRNAAAYFRTTFEVADPAVFESLDLQVTYDDAVAVYLNGRELLRTDNLPATADYRTYATADRADNSVENRTGLPPSLLQKGANLLAAEVHQRSPDSSDLSFALALTGLPRATVDPTALWNSVPPLFIDRSIRILARSWNGTNWSALAEASFNPDGIAPQSTTLALTEIAYRPPEPVLPAELAVTTDRDDYEFVELQNTGGLPLDLTGLRLAGGIEFDFATAPSRLAILAPGARILVVADRAAFEARYGPGLPVAGEFRGHLSNDGDTLRLETAAGEVLRRLAYRTGPPWPAGPLTDGTSLVLVRPLSNPDPADPTQWRTSRLPGGNPGSSDARPFPTQPDGDTDGNGRPDLVDYALGSTRLGLEAALGRGPGLDGQPATWLELVHPIDPLAEEARAGIEAADSLGGPWTATPAGLVFLGTEATADGGFRARYRAVPGISGQSTRYFRLIVTR